MNKDKAKKAPQQELNYECTGDMVLINLRPIDEFTPGGIRKPDSMIDDERRESGIEPHELLSVGEQAKVHGYKEGDLVIFNSHMLKGDPSLTNIVVMDGITYCEVPCHTIIAKVKNKELYLKRKAERDAIKKVQEEQKYAKLAEQKGKTLKPVPKENVN